MAPLFRVMLESTKTPTPEEGAMERFIHQYEKEIIGHLSGFDRLVLRGTIRALAVKSGMLSYLWNVGVLLKDAGKLFNEKSKQLKEASLEAANRLNRPVVYLASAKTGKEDMARQIAERDAIDSGLICVLTSVEQCQTYEIYRNRATKHIQLEPRIRKCLFLYHYWIDPVFGFMHARIQSWFPFSIRVCLNGREWLSRMMDKANLPYRRLENCFAWLEDPTRAQALMDEQLKTDWPCMLSQVAKRLNPSHEQILAPFQEPYYWSTYQSEWATDIMFKSPQALAKIYPFLVRSGICVFGAKDVMRFLGKKPHPNFQGEAVSHYVARSEGIRLKHALKANSVKIYDKQGSILRVETTINDPSDFKVYRPKEGDPDGPRSWQRMRRGIADLYRRAEVSQASNARYLDSLASIKVERPLGELVEALCRPALWKGRSVRALRPWSHNDTILLKAVSRGEFNINGFRNRDILQFLFPGKHDPVLKRRLSTRVTHRLRMLRAHGIIQKVPRTLRYVLTEKGREIISAIIHVQHIPITKIVELAA
jgi:hypothetical protein